MSLFFTSFISVFSDLETLLHNRNFSQSNTGQFYQANVNCICRMSM